VSNCRSTRTLAGPKLLASVVLLLPVAKPPTTMIVRSPYRKRLTGDGNRRATIATMNRYQATSQVVLRRCHRFERDTLPYHQRMPSHVHLETKLQCLLLSDRHA
jgi:hypothetical protein